MRKLVQVDYSMLTRDGREKIYLVMSLTCYLMHYIPKIQLQRYLKRNLHFKLRLTTDGGTFEHILCIF